MARIVAESGKFAASLCARPTTPGQIQINKVNEMNGTIDPFALSKGDYLELLLFARKVALPLYRDGVQRVGLASDGTRFLLIPMLGLSGAWQPVLAPGSPFDTSYQGFLTSKSGPQQHDSTLTPLLNTLLPHSTPIKPDLTFHGDLKDDNLFAKLVRGDLLQWRVWEDDAHVAALTPFPNVPGGLCVVPRRHLPSDIFSLKEDDYAALIQATYQVAQVLKAGQSVDRVGMFFEGYEIDYAHVKLYPVPAVASNVPADDPPFFDTYPGFLTTQEGPES